MKRDPEEEEGEEEEAGRHVGEERARKKAKPLNLKIHSSVAGSCENLPTQRSPLHSDHSLRSYFFPSLVPSTPPVHASDAPTAKWQRVIFGDESRFFVMETTNASLSEGTVVSTKLL
ncbi:hypothetical protein NFI96_006691 [Prochilodus magdalenae]|nr:hypothetical protein NFI96_006691 [Prochilodus magdalenae]